MLKKLAPPVSNNSPVKGKKLSKIDMLKEKLSEFYGNIKKNLENFSNGTSGAGS